MGCGWRVRAGGKVLNKTTDLCSQLKQNNRRIKCKCFWFGAGWGRTSPEVLNTENDLHSPLMLAAKNYMHVLTDKLTHCWLCLLMMNNSGQNMYLFLLNY
jgi:hypothetical protein